MDQLAIYSTRLMVWRPDRSLTVVHSTDSPFHSDGLAHSDRTGSLALSRPRVATRPPCMWSCSYSHHHQLPRQILKFTRPQTRVHSDGFLVQYLSTNQRERDASSLRGTCVLHSDAPVSPLRRTPRASSLHPFRRVFINLSTRPHGTSSSG